MHTRTNTQKYTYTRKLQVMQRFCLKLWQFSKNAPLGIGHPIVIILCVAFQYTQLCVCMCVCRVLVYCFENFNFLPREILSEWFYMRTEIERKIHATITARVFVHLCGDTNRVRRVKLIDIFIFCCSQIEHTRYKLLKTQYGF
jgi:hypothetical protein